MSPVGTRTQPVQPHIKVRDANERRLSSLAGQGIRIVVDGSDVLEFVLDHVGEGWSERDFERQWVRHVSALLDRVDADLTTSRDPVSATTRPGVSPWRSCRRS